jgi:hypothetical protein
MLTSEVFDSSKKGIIKVILTLVIEEIIVKDMRVGSDKHLFMYINQCK